MIKRALLGIAVGLLVLAAALILNTLRLANNQVEPQAVTLPSLESAPVAERLAGALRIPTVSHQSQDDGGEHFTALHAYLRDTFPRVHSTLDVTTVAEHSLLYRWRGSHNSLAPILLLAHQDVVPVEPSSTSAWIHPPFAGTIADGYVWGRGAMDFKNGVVGILEATEQLLQANFTPRRDIYFAFGHDEEIGGHRGAKFMAERLREAGLQFELILDEGMAITDGVVPGLAQPVALIGVAEKGYATFSLTVEREGGHSSMPPRHTTLGELSAALVALEQAPMPAALAGPARSLFRTLAPHMGFGTRLLFANTWLTEPLIARVLSNKPSTNALIRTTTAVTMATGSNKENVLPSRAQAAVNFRILPGDTIASVQDYVAAVVGPNVRVERSGFDNAEPSPVSPAEGPVFQQLQRTIRGVFPEVLVAPSLVLGATDARHYVGLSPHIYRFSPMVIRPGDTERLHGINERQSVEEYVQGVKFYIALLQVFGEG